ncbi:hypothetical protein [Synechococcus sp. UW105]|jgi:hypothetical protein|uniref:hypothetical protein n=1 Tax=unclassified Synechococcus TaxID=2626047 RepID=UPI001483973A|nr:hypothetical protein [Synechococcus sp. UW105]|tara:strand:- start:638 stop:802 length:165 start_codon:yes stop_codon:yes gene_type:complete
MTLGDGMVELLTAALALTAICVAVLMLADSDDDNSGGGLMEPSLVPIPIRTNRR